MYLYVNIICMQNKSQNVPAAELKCIVSGWSSLELSATIWSTSLLSEDSSSANSDSESVAFSSSMLIIYYYNIVTGMFI